MTALRRGVKATRDLCDACAQSTLVFARDVGHGLLAVGHNSLALVGLGVVAAALFVAGRDDVRHAVETHALGWLQARHDARVEEPASTQAPATTLAVTQTAAALPAPAVLTAAETTAVSRATAADPKELTRQQSAVAHWLARRYRVAPEPVSRLVKEAWNVAPRVGLDPTLVLAIMAIESSFNPFAQSPVGAQGLMQVMTRLHNVKYERFGGTLAAFDPVTNLKVGVQVLKECIARAGSIEAGLRHYVGAANLADDGGYASKVLAEQNHLRNVAGGQAVAPTVRTVVVAATAPRAAAPAALATTPTRFMTTVAPPAGAAAPSPQRDDTVPAKPADEVLLPEQAVLAS